MTMTFDLEGQGYSLFIMVDVNTCIINIHSKLSGTVPKLSDTIPKEKFKSCSDIGLSRTAIYK